MPTKKAALETPTPASSTLPLPPMPPRLPPRSIVAILGDLSRPIPQECIAQIEATTNRTTGKTRPAQDYLHWHTVTAILDTYAPGWEGTIVRVEKIGSEGKERIAVVYRLTIHAAEGRFSQEDAGMEDEDKDDFGDAMTSAIATALKRAAAKFGLGRQQLYDKDKRTAAFLLQVRQEKKDAIKDLGSVADAKGYPRKAVLAWLCRHHGVVRADDIPLHSVKALTRQLEGKPDVVLDNPVTDESPTTTVSGEGPEEDAEHIDQVTGEILDAWQQEDEDLRQMPTGWLTETEHRAQQAREEAVLLAPAAHAS